MTKNFIILIARDLKKVSSFEKLQKKIISYFGERMVEDYNEESSAIELKYPLTEDDREAINDMLEDSEFVAIELIGEDTVKYDNLLSVTNVSC